MITRITESRHGVTFETLEEPKHKKDTPMNKEALKQTFLAGWDAKLNSDTRNWEPLFEKWYADTTVMVAAFSGEATSPTMPLQSKCNKMLLRMNLPYPRTCAICKLGPCIQDAPTSQGRKYLDEIKDIEAEGQRAANPEWRTTSRDHPKR